MAVIIADALKTFTEKTGLSITGAPHQRYTGPWNDTIHVYDMLSGNAQTGCIIVDLVVNDLTTSVIYTPSAVPMFKAYEEWKGSLPTAIDVEDALKPIRTQAFFPMLAKPPLPRAAQPQPVI